MDEILVLDTYDIFVRVYIQYLGGKRAYKQFVIDVSYRGFLGHSVRVTLDDYDDALSDCIDQYISRF